MSGAVDLPGALGGVFGGVIEGSIEVIGLVAYDAGDLGLGEAQDGGADVDYDDLFVGFQDVAEDFVAVLEDDALGGERRESEAKRYDEKTEFSREVHGVQPLASPDLLPVHGL